MFDASGLPVWRHTARCESEASRASYASQRKLDKRIILIALAQRFPSSRSTWWSARSPPCYSPRASQVSACMSVFISQVALACLFFFFFPSLPSILPPCCAQVWMGSGWFISLCRSSVNCGDNQISSGRAKKKQNTHAQWLNMLLACNYLFYRIYRAYCTEHNTVVVNTHLIDDTPAEILA